MWRALVLLLTVAACSDSTGASADPAGLRVINLSSDSPPFDVFMDDVPVLSGVAFPFNTPFVVLRPRAHTVALTLEGDSSAAAQLELTTNEMRSQGLYTAVVLAPFRNLRAFVIEEPAKANPSGLRLRFINAAVGLGAVTTACDGTVRDVALADGDVGALFEVSASAPNMTLDLDDDGAWDLDFTLPNIRSGFTANAFIVRNAESVFILTQFTNGFLLRTEADAAALRVVYATQLGDPLTVFGNGAVLSDALTAGSVVDYSDARAGFYSFAAGPQGTIAFAARGIDGHPILASGGRYTLAVFSRGGRPAAVTLNDDAANVRVVHVASVDTVGLIVDGGAPFALAPGATAELDAVSTLGLDLDLNGVAEQEYGPTSPTLFVADGTSGTTLLQLNDGAAALTE